MRAADAALAPDLLGGRGDELELPALVVRERSASRLSRREAARLARARPTAWAFQSAKAAV